MSKDVLWDEDDLFPETRKEQRQARKQATARDRSKFKVTDQKKQRDPAELHPNIKGDKESFQRGRVLEITSQGWQVESEERIYACSLKGVLKKERGKKKNLIAVGDFVLFEALPDMEGVIVHVEPRTSVLSRADNLSRRKEHLIAANIDQVLITASMVAPVLKPPLLDRYIIAARKGGMAPVVVINKIDLLDPEASDDSPEHIEEQAQLLDEARAAYAALDIPFLEVSADKDVGLDDLKQIMRGKASVFSGQSGVGKTSLINAVTGRDLTVGDVVWGTRKGAHTTTSPKLLQLEEGGWCIDTPGIKSFGMWELEQAEVVEFFPEITQHSADCKYPNCTHRQEPHCAVKNALEDGSLSPLRYQSYVSLMEAVVAEHKRR